MAQKNEKNEKTHFWCLKFGAWSSNLHRAKGGEIPYQQGKQEQHQRKKKKNKSWANRYIEEM